MEKIIDSKLLSDLEDPQYVEAILKREIQVPGGYYLEAAFQHIIVRDSEVLATYRLYFFEGDGSLLGFEEFPFPLIANQAVTPKDGTVDMIQDWVDYTEITN